MSEKTHNCDAAVLHCMDWRIGADGAFRRELGRAAGIKDFDAISVAGGAKSILDGATRKVVLGYIDLSYRLHHIKKVVLTNHTECGAYGDVGTEEKIVSDLFAAKKIVLGHFSGLEIHLVLIRLFFENGSWRVRCEKIEEKDREAVAV